MGAPPADDRTSPEMAHSLGAVCAPQVIATATISVTWSTVRLTVTITIGSSSPETRWSILRRLLLHVIDDEYRHWALLLFELEAELFLHRFENSDGIGGIGRGGRCRRPGIRFGRAS